MDHQLQQTFNWAMMAGKDVNMNIVEEYLWLSYRGAQLNDTRIHPLVQDFMIYATWTLQNMIRAMTCASYIELDWHLWIMLTFDCCPNY